MMKDKFTKGFSLIVWSKAFMFELIFFVAFLNPTKKVIVNIDRFGEANLEFILMLILSILTIPWFIMTCQSIRRLNSESR